MKTISPQKRYKAETIEQAVLKICEFYQADWRKIYLPVQVKTKPEFRARQAIAWHLYRCGMSYDAIARHLMRSPDIARECVVGYRHQTPLEVDMMARLPMVPNTVEMSGLGSNQRH